MSMHKREQDGSSSWVDFIDDRDIRFSWRPTEDGARVETMITQARPGTNLDSWLMASFTLTLDEVREMYETALHKQPHASSQS